MPTKKDLVVLSMAVPRAKVAKVKQTLKAANLDVEWVSAEEVWGDFGYVPVKREHDLHLAGMKELRDEIEAPDDEEF
jgi:hypothetical protein